MAEFHVRVRILSDTGDVLKETAYTLEASGHAAVREKALARLRTEPEWALSAHPRGKVVQVDRLG
jgi:hypothetical protein